MTWDEYTLDQILDLIDEAADPTNGPVAFEFNEDNWVQFEYRGNFLRLAGVTVNDRGSLVFTLVDHG